MCKKKLYIIINSMICGGAEKSLVSFLNELDFNKFDVYLQMFNPTGDFIIFLNKNVKILDKFDFIDFCGKNLAQQLPLLNIKYIFSRFKLSIDLRKNKRLNDKFHDSQIYWENCKDCFEKSNKRYDIAIAWGQGLPTYYVAEKINADIKLAWINVDYEKAGYLKKYDFKFYKEIDRIILVSKDLYEIFKKIYPEFKNKMKIIYDINSFELVKKMSLEKSCIEKKQGINLITVGRLVPPKGYDLAINAARILKEKNIVFKWYIIGEGPERPKLEKMIKQCNLQNNIILKGMQINPYKYIDDADIYVQTSKFEGYCITLAEARMLNKPIITTNFDVVYDQIKHEENGLIVDMEPKSLSKAIIRLIEDRKLVEYFINNLKNEKKGNREEINKFYRIIEEYN